ncbi:PREDICTED: olfactory receptor 6K6-like [Odobenus rosmarus divergens]|uniref:Olfactory receptor 6K6-like n=1 Tax=Odobenus rosmarus divergens TaxID=9708 RepID=A0A9B0HCJ9_ODORO
MSPWSETRSCLCGFLLVLAEITWIATLPFCGSIQIRQIFCDFTPVLSSACTDTSLVVTVDAIHAAEVLASFLAIALSYVRIILVIPGDAVGNAPARLHRGPCHVCVAKAVTAARLRLASSSPPSWAPVLVPCGPTSHTQVRPDSRTEGA